jgi:hypothetical protein
MALCRTAASGMNIERDSRKLARATTESHGDLVSIRGSPLRPCRVAKRREAPASAPFPCPESAERGSRQVLLLVGTPSNSPPSRIAPCVGRELS